MYAGRKRKSENIPVINETGHANVPENKSTEDTQSEDGKKWR